METIIITKYIATWSYQIIAMIFLVASIIIFALPRTTLSFILFLACFFSFVGLEFITFRKQREVFEYE